MTKVILAFDDEDEHMGAFNRGCMEDFKEFLNGSEHDVILIQSARLNDLTIQYKTSGGKPFLFVAYSHGFESSLTSGGSDYISTTNNHVSFNRALFYTVSCHAAIKLGPCLIENGCQCFFGYKSPFNFWAGYKCFSQCANHGFFLFLKGFSTEDIYTEMIEEYNKQIDELFEQDAFIASLLVANRKALVFRGSNVTINDFAN